MFDPEINHSFMIVYMAAAFCGMGFAAWAAWEWYLISRRCRVLESALEREKTRRPLRQEAGDDPSVGCADSSLYAREPDRESLCTRETDRGSLYAREPDTSSGFARGETTFPSRGRLEKGREAAR